MSGSKLLIAAVALTISTQLISEVFAADTTSYIGAVVEYYPVTNGTNGTTIANANAENYVTIMEKAATYSTDIIVFPESSLTMGLDSSDTERTLFPLYSSFIPDPGTDVPCDNSSTVVMEALRLISCGAKNNSMYVVVNLHEKENCTTTGTSSRPCPSDGYFYYNTNVAFDRKGAIVSRYRKFNLFGEWGFNITSTPDIATFTTDFNVTFGQIICFDILFKTPTLTLINDYNVTDIIFSVHWFSEMPYLTSVQTQTAWSYTNDVNLLASGFNMPATGSGGSGIYAGTNGRLVSLFSESAKNALLVARVPKVIDGVRSNVTSTTNPLSYEFSNTEITTLVGITTVAQQALMQDILTPYTTSVLSLTNGTTVSWIELCDRQLCCSFYVNMTFDAGSVDSSANYYRYRIAVFNGVRTHSGVATTGVQICSIIACTDDTVGSCGLRFAATDTVLQPTVFNDIVVSGNFSTTSDTMQMPDSLSIDILPLSISDFTYKKTAISGSSLANITHALTTKTSNLLTFAIYGRNFSADGLAVTESVVSSAISFSRLSLVLTTVFAVLISLHIWTKY
ncbi:vanin-like protein 1 [Diprion similis]|uniref:vanin-like protein 1 n=1 Tax=Diprion similis TaxID=362088 RepID=UPI001EF7F6D9|nr:vanin-like protein 1 [Diprion similis]XP_046739492.1 vanin-like protein 1 [Diprion similis]XP_046739493.1 vanin-like protein 1 [Diprion similis]XP_046739494.1 vanin-like protein 1 [Diprion similis]